MSCVDPQLLFNDDAGCTGGSQNRLQYRLWDDAVFRSNQRDGISERPPDGQRCFMAIDHGYGSDGDVVVENARMTSDLNKSSLTPCRGKVLLSAMELSSQPMEPLGRC